MQNSAEESTGSHEAKTLSGLKEVCHVLNPTKAWLTFCWNMSHGSNHLLTIWPYISSSVTFGTLVPRMEFDGSILPPQMPT